jgi:hypothetical protein
MHIYICCHSNVSAILYIHEHILQYMAHSPCFLSPLVDSPLFPFVPLSDPLLLTWNPPSCDKIRPPRSQVACKLTFPVPTLFLNPPPLQIPRTPIAQRLTKTTSGIIWRLLSGTLMFVHYRGYCTVSGHCHL